MVCVELECSYPFLLYANRTSNNDKRHLLYFKQLQVILKVEKFDGRQLPQIKLYENDVSEAGT